MNKAMNRTKKRVLYIISDLISSAFAWVLFYLFRKIYLEPKKFGYTVDLEFNERFFIGLIAVPLFWIAIYALSGYYKDPYRKSRLKEFGQTLLFSLIGVTFIFFSLILDDEIPSYKSYYVSFLALFSLHFMLTFMFRFVLSSKTVHDIHQRIIGFPTLIVGANQKAIELYQELQGQRKSSGFNILGFVNVNGNGTTTLENHIQRMGHVTDIRSIIQMNKIEEVIIAIESSEHENIGKIMSMLEMENTQIKVIPDMYDILTGKVKMSSIFGAPLIDIKHEIMPPWQKSLKRILDIFVSIFVLAFLAPVFIILGIIIKLTSKGPVFYMHERIGKHGKPFRIYKFRSMYKDAEKKGPALSSKHDARITPLGKTLRQFRLDELPQFYNVLKGDMSLVGPRPERAFFIQQIMQKAPHYQYLQKVTPGITSWGQVKFGYAENVEQMIERLKYDILYIENMSLFVDFKILIYTVLIVLQGRGK